MKSTFFQPKKTGNQAFNNTKGKNSVLLNPTETLSLSVAENLVGSSANFQQQTGKKTTNLQKTNANDFKTTNPNATKTGRVKDPDSMIKSREMIKRVVLTDSEDRWFLNPQYKVEMKPTTKLIITLLQSDEKLSKIPYQKCNFMILISKVIFF